MKLALIDIDGVCANDKHRLHFALAKNYGAYFAPERMAADTIHPQGLELAQNAYALGYETAYLTGRRHDRREVTEDWLDSGGFPMGRLTMRTFTQTMPLANFKSEYIKKAIATGRYSEVVLFDDDPEVVRLVREQNGKSAAVHCTWQIKEKALIKLAKM